MKPLHNLIAVMFMVVISSYTAYAQQTISGKVIDDQTKEPLTGVSVVITGTQTGATTDLNGIFEIKAAKADSITVSYIGYQGQTFAWKGGTIISLKPSVMQLGQVIVSASREVQERKDAPIAIATLTPAVINDAKPNSLEQVLNKVSGVYMMNLGNEQHAMSIRQPLGYKSLFLYLEDGIPIRTAGLFNHNALIEINMATVKNIEIIKGPASSLYGQEAIGGAVNFITFGPSAVPTAKVAVQANNLGFKRTDFQASTTMKKLGVSVAGYYAKRKNGLMEHSDFDKLGLTLRADYHFSDKTDLSNSVSFIDYYSDMTGSLDSNKFAEHNYTNLHTFTYRDVSALRARSTLTQRWNPKSKTTFTALFRDNSIKQNPSYFVSDDYKPWNGTGDPLLAHGQINDAYFQSYAGVIQHRQSFDWKNVVAIIGVSEDFSPSGYYAKYIPIAKSPKGKYISYETTDSLLSDYTVDVLNSAAYAQLELSPLEHLRVVAAVRYDNFVYDLDNALDPSAYSGSPDSRNSFNALSPKLGFTYDIKGKSGVYANYSQGFVPPQITELYKGVKVPVLKPSTFYNYEIGGWAKLVKDKLYLDASIYRLDGTDEIISVRLDDGTYENRNAGQTKHQGVEYGVTVTPRKDIYVRISGTNAIHRFVDFVEQGKDYSWNDMANAPGFIANAEVMYKPLRLKGFRIGVEMQHMNSYYMDPANTVEYDGFTVFNLRTGYEWKGLGCWINWLNVADKHYAVVASKSQWGYSYTLGDPSNVNIGLSYAFQGKNK
ncbi:MAG: TonB-dependent receptor [Flavobacteriales bacterium]|nr:TonB-dependent receptor [Flavobacteriales bacterium]